MFRKLFSRRKFLKSTGFAFWVLAVTPGKANSQTEDTPVDKAEFVAKFGRTLIPSEEELPGYRELEKYAITGEVLNKLRGIPDSSYVTFNNCSKSFFSGLTFIELSASQSEELFGNVLEKKLPADTQAVCEMVYNVIRLAVYTVYYQNFPEIVHRDSADLPVLQEGEAHQIINPNTHNLFTGWDHAGFGGPWDWEQEEERRRYLRDMAKSVPSTYHRFIG